MKLLRGKVINNHLRDFVDNKLVPSKRMVY